MNKFTRLVALMFVAAVSLFVQSASALGNYQHCWSEVNSTALTCTRCCYLEATAPDCYFLPGSQSTCDPHDRYMVDPIGYEDCLYMCTTTTSQSVCDGTTC